jgi:hypothetical protein
MTTDFRARAALSAPEQGPTDEDLYDVAEQFNGDPIPAMRRALELWGRPAVEPVPEGPTDEQLVELTDSYGVSVEDIGPLVSIVLTRWGRPAVEPVPVAERLPGPEDCDDQGRCWWLDRWQRHKGEVATVWLMRRPDDWPTIIRPIAWAPHWALPLPQEGE